MITNVGRRKARFCHAGCADSYRCDIRHDLIYGAIHTPEGVYTPERWSLVAGTCCYCGSQVTMQPHFGKLGPNWGPEHSKHPEVALCPSLESGAPTTASGRSASPRAKRGRRQP